MTTTAPVRLFKTKADAVAVAGTLSAPSKMPCHGYSIPASACITGTQLQSIEGSVCSDCYACKGRYMFPNVQQAMQRRLDSIIHPDWVKAMVTLIGSAPYFRWHDSGDLQSVNHLRKIVEIAELLPNTRFWLPTRERKFVNAYLEYFGDFPPNLIVRVSAAMVDAGPPVDYEHTSTVHDLMQPFGYACPAPQQGNQCGSCRACWDAGVANVSYSKH